MTSGVKGCAFAERGGVADLGYGKTQSDTLAVGVESVDQGLSQIRGVDLWNSAAVTY
jgi:hypothetical protein